MSLITLLKTSHKLRCGFWVNTWKLVFFLMIEEVHSLVELEHLLEKNRLVALLIYDRFTMYSINMKYILDSFAIKYSKVKFYKCDGPKLEDLCMAYSIILIPTVIFFTDKKVFGVSRAFNPLKVEDLLKLMVKL